MIFLSAVASKFSNTLRILLVLNGCCMSLEAASVFFSSSTAGSEATVPTNYGDSVYVMRPGVNVNPAFKVEDMQTNWSKHDSPNSGFSNSADMLPIAVRDIPIINYGGDLYIALGMDFNEAGSSPDFDVVNIMLWTGSASANTQQAAISVDPVTSLAWTNPPSNSVQNKWENNLRVMQSNHAAVGLNLIYEQNASPQIFAAGDTRPYDSDPHRVYSSGLGTLGSNEVDVAILVPASVLQGTPLDDVLYLGMQTGTLNDGGSDRFGIVDPNTIVSGGYFDSLGVTFTTIPEPGTASLLLISALLASRRRR